MALRAISLCAGIGGIDLGLAAAVPGFRTVCFVEIEAFCAAILAARMADGSLDDAPIWDDLKSFDGKQWRGAVDIVTAGYPCQPFSSAGRRRGHDDPRHLWPHVARIIDECRPTYAFLENVPGHVSLGLRDVCADLRGMGYAISAGIFSAAECGAPHLRKRLFILAADPAGELFGRGAAGRRGKVRQDAAKLGGHGETRPLADTHDAERRPDSASRCQVGEPDNCLPQGWQQGDGEPASGGAYVADADSQRQSQLSALQRQERRRPADGRDAADDDGVKHPCGPYGGSTRCLSVDRPKPRVGGRAAGLPGWMDGWERGLERTCAGAPHRSDQLKALGNAVVPASAALAFATLADSLGCQMLVD